MGRAAPDRAPLPRGKGAGRSPKAGDGRGSARAYAGRGKQKAPRPPGQRGAQTRGKTPLPSGLYRRHRNSTGSAAADGPQLAGFHRRWGLAPRPEAAPLYHAAPPGATLFCHARAARGRDLFDEKIAGSFHAMPAHARAGRHSSRARAADGWAGREEEQGPRGGWLGGADVRGTGRRPGTARHENRARAAICRAGPSFFPRRRRRRFAAAGGGLRPAQYTLRRT